MEFAAFLDTLRRRWFIPFALTVLAIVGVYTYHLQMDEYTAQVTVAVLDPQLARPGVRPEARVSFDSIMKSRTLVDRVASRLNRRAELIAGHLSVANASISVVLSPLFAVRATDRSLARAMLTATVAAEEARNLYKEVNFGSTDDLKALTAESQRFSLDLKQARSDLDKFTQANDAGDLPTRIAGKLEAVRTLELQIHEAEAGLAVALQAGGPYVRLSQAQLSSLRHSLGSEQGQLKRLEDLRAQFDDLSFKLQLATAHATQADESLQAIILAQDLPLDSVVKTLDAAAPQSNALGALLTYVLAFFFGALTGLSAIYVLAKRRNRQDTAETVASTFGARVLIRLPRATT